MNPYDVCAIVAATLIFLGVLIIFVKSCRSDSGSPYRRGK